MQQQVNAKKTNNKEPWSKSKLLTNGIGIQEIPDLYWSERFSTEQTMQKVGVMTKPTYTHDEIYGQYCTVNGFIDCPLEKTFEYAANVFSLEEWTYSVRDLKYEGNGLYKGTEKLAPNTFIYVRCDAYPDSHVVDYLCAWDQGQELWMRYYFRFMDAQPTFGRPGTVVTWLNCHHPNYDRDASNLPKFVTEAQNRKDRPWVGDFWKFFYAGHALEFDNLKKILEHRFSSFR